MSTIEKTIISFTFIFLINQLSLIFMILILLINKLIISLLTPTFIIKIL